MQMDEQDIDEDYAALVQEANQIIDSDDNYEDDVIDDQMSDKMDEQLQKAMADKFDAQMSEHYSDIRDSVKSKRSSKSSKMDTKKFMKSSSKSSVKSVIKSSIQSKKESDEYIEQFEDEEPQDIEQNNNLEIPSFQKEKGLSGTASGLIPKASDSGIVQSSLSKNNTGVVNDIINKEDSV